MNDGTFSTVVTRPLTRPTSTLSPATSGSTHQLRPGSPSPTRAETTTHAVISAPTDRSNSPATITNSSPSATASKGADRLRNAISDGGSANDGSRHTTPIRTTIRTNQIGGTARSS